MNKLISRNPVERFKLGRKIPKAGFGTVLEALGHTIGLHTPETKNGITKVPQITGDYIYTKEGRYGRMATPEEIEKAWGKPKRTNPSDRVLSKLNEVSDIYDDNGNLLMNPKKIAKRRDYNKGQVTYKQDNNGIWYAKWNDPNKPNQGFYRVAEGSTGYNRAGDHNVLKNGEWVKVLELDSIPVTVTNRTSQPRFWNKYNYRTEDIGADKIKEWQRKLGVKDDGIWGDITESAYLKYLDLNKPSLKPVPQVEGPKESPVLLPTYVTAPTNRPTIAITQRIPTAKVFNRADTRDFIRRKGFGAYDFTGALRRALRMVLNGQGTDEDLAVVKAMGLFKLGGQLPSRNIVERFKQRNFRLVAQ